MQITTDIELTPDQGDAKSIILDLLNAGRRHVSLVGYAGSGKTTLVAHMAEELQMFGYTVYACAPTHKAARVLGSKMPIETRTIHSFLGLAYRPNYKDGGYFLSQNPNTELPKEGVVLLDESSMIGTQLWKYIDSAPGLQWLFIGDSAQLPPVAERPSPALEVEGAVLSNIVRQAAGNPILRMASAVRKGDPYLEKADYNGQAGIVLTRDSSRFMRSILKAFSRQDESSAPTCRVLTYRNAMVAWYNENIRKELLGKNNPPRFAAGDWLMMNDSYREEDEVLALNSEELQVEAVRIGKHVTTGGFWRTYFLAVRRENGDIVELPVLHQNENVRYRATLGKLKHEAIRKHRPWPDYYSLKEAFADASHAYAMTVHKSQGSTFHTAYVDHVDLMTCKTKEKQALVYVAATRPSERLALLI